MKIAQCTVLCSGPYIRISYYFISLNKSPGHLFIRVWSKGGASRGEGHLSGVVGGWGWGWGWGGGWSWVLFLALKLIVKWSGWGGVGCFLKQDWHCQGTHALVWWLVRKNIFNEWFAFALNDHFDREDFFTCFPSKWQYWHDAYRFRD